MEDEDLEDSIDPTSRTGEKQWEPRNGGPPNLSAGIREWVETGDLWEGLRGLGGADKKRRAFPIPVTLFAFFLLWLFQYCYHVVFLSRC